MLEQSCQVWHSALTEDNSNDLERVQKNALKIILGEKYGNYESALLQLNLQDLKTRREILNEKFAIKCKSNLKTSRMFPIRTINKTLRQNEKYIVTHARTERLKNTSIPHMQRQLNNKF